MNVRDLSRQFAAKAVLAGGLAIAVLGPACDRESEESTSETTREAEAAESSEPADSGGEPSPREVFERRHERAGALVDRLVETAKKPFASADAPERATFPGGAGVEWSSVESPPKAGATYTLEPPGAGGVDSGDGTAETSVDTSSRDPIAGVLGLEPGVELPVQFVYRTGDGTGTEATATIRAVADFDPSTDADHTLVQELSVDPKTGAVNVFPRLVRNRWE